MIVTVTQQAHIEELQRQLAEANSQVEHFKREKFRMIDMMLDKVHAKNETINHLLDCIGPWHGPLNRDGSR